MILADIFANLASGWFATILILPGIGQNQTLAEAAILFINSLINGIVYLLISFRIKDIADEFN